MVCELSLLATSHIDRAIIWRCVFQLKRSQSIDAAQAMSGLMPLSDDEGESPRYEVWVHEPCAVWSPGVCLVDTRLMGLQEAVWHCQQAVSTLKILIEFMMNT